MTDPNRLWMLANEFVAADDKPLASLVGHSANCRVSERVDRIDRGMRDVLFICESVLISVRPKAEIPFLQILYAAKFKKYGLCASVGRTPRDQVATIQFAPVDDLTDWREAPGARPKPADDVGRQQLRVVLNSGKTLGWHVDEQMTKMDRLAQVVSASDKTG